MITLIYDGYCTFCIAWLDRLKRLDHEHRITLVDAHAPDLLERFPVLNGAQLDGAMFAIDEHGTVSSGFDAFRAALSILATARWWVWSWWIPGVAPVGRAVYGYIARNRHRYGCGPTCAIK